MTEEEKIICKSFLHDADNTHSCNEYKLLMELLEQEPSITREEAEEAIKTVKEHCYFASLVPAAREALDLMIKTVEDFEALNAINLDLASENEDLVERIGKLIGYIDFLRNTAQGKKKSLNLLEKVVKGELEEIRAEGENFVKPKTGEWIPVTERLPEEYLCNDGYVEPSDYVLVWGDHGNYDVSRYWGNRRSKSESPNTYKDWVDLDWVVQKPIAWMPLPEPYEGGE